MEFLWDGGTKVCSNSPGHMTKMAAMPIYGKKLQKSSSLQPKGWWPWNLVCIIGCSSTTKFAQMMTLVDLDLFYRKVKFGPYAFVWWKGKTMDFSEIIVVYDLKLATDDRSDKKFLLTSKLCPLGAVCSLLRCYIHVHVLNLKTFVYNQISKRFLWSLQQMGKVTRPFLLTSKFCPLGAVCLCPGAIYMY